MPQFFRVFKKKQKNKSHLSDKNKKTKRIYKRKKSSRRCGIYVSMTEEMKQYCKDQAIIHNSMSGYIRHLIALDMRGLIKPQQQKIVYQLPKETEITYRKEEITMRPPRKKESQIPLGMNYGVDHGELMSELKAVLKSRAISISESEQSLQDE